MDFQQSQTYQNVQFVLSELFETHSFLNIFETIAYEEVLIQISFLFNTSARNIRYITNALYNILYGKTSTLENLEFARAREDDELRKYRDYSVIALEEGYLHDEEIKGVKKVLSAAAMTYVAAAAVSVAQLLRLILLSNRRRD